MGSRWFWKRWIDRWIGAGTAQPGLINFVFRSKTVYESLTDTAASISTVQVNHRHLVQITNDRSLREESAGFSSRSPRFQSSELKDPWANDNHPLWPCTIDLEEYSKVWNALTPRTWWPPPFYRFSPIRWLSSNFAPAYWPIDLSTSLISVNLFNFPRRYWWSSFSSLKR